jgi:hypothetical protein
LAVHHAVRPAFAGISVDVAPDFMQLLAYFSPFEAAL